MKLSTKSRYGLRILLQITLDSVGNAPVKGNVIAKKQDLSEPYLEQIMIPLKNAGLVRTVRGCNGGYVLNRTPEKITLLNIIELFEGELQLVNCDDCRRSCATERKCASSVVWKNLSNALREEASKITLEDIAKMSKEDLPEYVI
jgi:Rrf2 family protein